MADAIIAQTETEYEIRVSRGAVRFIVRAANINDAVAAPDRCPGVATNAVDLLIVIPAAVAGVGLTPKEPNGRAIRAAGDPTPGATSVVRPHCVPRETREVACVGIRIPGDNEPSPHFVGYKTRVLRSRLRLGVID